MNRLVTLLLLLPGAMPTMIAGPVLVYGTGSFACSTVDQPSSVSFSGTDGTSSVYVSYSTPNTGCSLFPNEAVYYGGSSGLGYYSDPSSYATINGVTEGPFGSFAFEIGGGGGYLTLWAEPDGADLVAQVDLQAYVTVVDYYNDQHGDTGGGLLITGVPEPKTLALVPVGFALLALSGRAKRKRGRAAGQLS
jgi:hypothetical protein